MLPLPKPSITNKDVFTKSISNYEQPMYTKLSGCTNLIEKAGDEYLQRADAGRLWTLESTELISTAVTADEIRNVYTNKIAKKDQPGRYFYDLLTSVPIFGRCPLCAHRIVSTLDHYLPKSKYPIYSTIPINLVPSCMECNKNKIAKILNCADDQLLHPYFDDISGYQWLEATVNHTNPVSFKFTVKPHSTWDITLTNRVKLHFQTLELASLYGSNAGSELSGVKLLLQSYFKNGGTSKLRSELQSKQISFMEYNLNCWQVAMYKALEASDWFCSYGVLL